MWGDPGDLREEDVQTCTYWFYFLVLSFSGIYAYNPKACQLRSHLLCLIARWLPSLKQTCLYPCNEVLGKNDRSFFSSDLLELRGSKTSSQRFFRDCFLPRALLILKGSSFMFPAYEILIKRTSKSICFRNWTHVQCTDYTRNLKTVKVALPVMQY